MKKFLLISFVLASIFSQGQPRERVLFDSDWKFSFGHATDVSLDFSTGTSYFNYYTKAGYGDGAAAADFDCRTWRDVELPHDWAVEMPFDAKGSHSHGYKAVGQGFPETSVGWYRKNFFIPESDKGKRVFIEFDGVFRDSKVWVNGFYCGNEPSGYLGFSYDITEFINFGKENCIAVRADAYFEEGWFYEGAGIYRHVWLTKVSPLHVVQNGTCVTAEINETSSKLTVKTNIINKGTNEQSFDIKFDIKKSNGDIVATKELKGLSLKSFNKNEYFAEIEVTYPELWSIENPNIYTLATIVTQNNAIVDQQETPFGIRSIRFDADKGFFLNNKHVKLVGTNNHQDHAGVGVALPDALQEWRIRRLKSMGCNVYRSSHNPPSPELLDICDRLGMLVIDENRLMGVTDYNLSYLRRLIERDRNHPSVILWSIGNEEWAIEGNQKGADITRVMQNFVKSIDASRPVNAAISGGWGHGISTVIEVMGYNYLTHGNTDEQHNKFPWQPSLGTEEGSTHTTRGIYVTDKKKQYMAAYDRPTEDGNFMSIHDSWNYYADRDYLAGVCYWTGFDYRGESTPFTWPSVTSYFGIFDLCGFPKDNYFYLKSWWSNETVLHLLPHWNCPENKDIPVEVVAYSNCNEVELFLNDKSLGKKTMKRNGFISWSVNYEQGTLKATGYVGGKKNIETEVSTSGETANILLLADRKEIAADGRDLTVITVKATDKHGVFVPDANIPVYFSVEGPGRIIGVGNGDPTSHEKERFIESVEVIEFESWNESDETNPAGNTPTESTLGNRNAKRLYSSSFVLTDSDIKQGSISWMFRSIGHDQTIYINGHIIKDTLSGTRPTIKLDKQILNIGKNTVKIVAVPYVKKNQWDNVNTNPGSIQIIKPSEQWHRKTFNGLAQVLLQSTGKPGTVILRATSEKTPDTVLSIETK